MSLIRALIPAIAAGCVASSENSGPDIPGGSNTVDESTTGQSPGTDNLVPPPTAGVQVVLDGQILFEEVLRTVEATIPASTDCVAGTSIQVMDGGVFQDGQPRFSSTSVGTQSDMDDTMAGWNETKLAIPTGGGNADFWTGTEQIAVWDSDLIVIDLIGGTLCDADDVCVPAEGTLTYAGPRDLPGSMENPAPSHWIDAATDEFICEGRPDSGGT